MSENKKTIKIDVIITVTFLSFIYGIFIMQICKQDRFFSDTERRILEQRPEPSWKRILQGTYQTDYETYLTDQFAFRDFWVRTKGLTEYLSGKQENHGIYYGKEGYLMETLTEIDEGKLKKNVDAILSFQDNLQSSQSRDRAQSHQEKSDLWETGLSVKLCVGLIPGSTSINRDKLPENLPEVDQQEQIHKIYQQLSKQGITCIPVSEKLLQHKEEALFYRTDHHWTSLGAYYGYEAWSEAVQDIAMRDTITQGGMQATITRDGMKTESDKVKPDKAEPDKTWAAKLESGSFYGTLYDRAGTFWIPPDHILSYVPEEGIRVERLESRGWEQGKLYDREKLQGRDQYAMFLGGNGPLVHISSDKGEGKLLVIRDSYMDSLAPFLTADYEDIYLMDPRYYRGSAWDFIRENKITQVWICYSFKNFTEDTNLPYVLRTMYP